MNGLRLSTYQSRSGETTPEASLRPLSNPGNRDREWHSAFVPHHDRRHFLLTANPKRYPYHGNIQSRWISCLHGRCGILISFRLSSLHSRLP